jgi:uncharacterized short protein YbdD (DUF466 family)
MKSPIVSVPAPSPLRGKGAFRTLWRTLRAVVGDDAYEQYCAHHQVRHPNEPTLDRRAFYVKNQTEKWSGIKRCC